MGIERLVKQHPVLDLFTIVWGDEMTRTYIDAVLPSILQSDNIPACSNLLHAYSFYTVPDSEVKIKSSSLYQKLSGCLEIKWFPLQKGLWETTNNVIHQMRLSAAENHYMAIIPPDTIFGNGSIINLARLCTEGHNPILYSFPRVTDAGFQEITARLRSAGSISNRLLVSLAMKHLEQCTYPITELWPDGWRVQHNVPTPCIRPDEKIISVFSTNTLRNSGYDHTLPFIMVEMGYPWHLIKHSDIFFQVERGRHLIEEGYKPDSGYWKSDKQAAGVRLFESQYETWKGEL